MNVGCKGCKLHGRVCVLNWTSRIDMFQRLPSGAQFSTDEALKPENRVKNRYKDLYPCMYINWSKISNSSRFSH